MFGTIIALLFATIVVTAVFLPPVLRLPWIDATKRLLHRRVRCPATGETMACTLERDTYEGRWTQVHRCSAFGSVGTLGCDQQCLATIGSGPERPASRAR